MRIDWKLLGNIATRVFFAALSALCIAVAVKWWPSGNDADWDMTIGFGIAGTLFFAASVVPRPWKFMDVVTSNIHYWP